MVDTGSPALNAPTLSAERRALEIAVKALREIHLTVNVASLGALIPEQRAVYEALYDYIKNTLADLAALVPDAGEPHA